MVSKVPPPKAQTTIGRGISRNDAEKKGINVNDSVPTVANITGAEYFHAGSAADLRTVYQNLSAKIALERQETEVSALFSALAALLVIGAAVLSLLWFHRSA